MRIFNTTGTCIPQKHFVADVSGKVKQVMEMIARGDYFAVTRPRQYGKTTMIYMLFQQMRKDKGYLPLDVSLEGIGASTYVDSERFIPAFLDLLIMRLEFMGETEAAALLEKNRNIDDFVKLNRFITRFVRETGRKVVLMIDEVDKSSNNQLFLDFLGMLRTKFLGQNEGKDHSFHSVILVGVHDVKTLKAKIRPHSDQKYNSPWNIAVNFKVDLALFPGEITSMLNQYAEERGVTIDIPFFAEQLFYLTSGYPFLVSLLCKIMDEEMLPHKEKREWEAEDLAGAVQIALKEDNTNFETLIKNLRNNPDLYELVFNVIMNEREYSYNRDNPVIGSGILHGVLAEKEGKVKVHNRLYEQRIYNYMASEMETAREIKFAHAGVSYVDKAGGLDLKKAIRAFQAFMKEQYDIRDMPFLERNGRLLFLTFIKPVINGKGFDFKEVEISEEKRLDIVITYGNHKYIVELKIWRGEARHKAGISQLCDYLDRQNQGSGYLLIYDLRKETGKQGHWEELRLNDKNLYLAWI